MTWLLSTKIGRSLASLGGLLVLGLTFLKLDRRKTRKDEREVIRRRAAAGAEKREEDRDEIEEDMRQLGYGDAADKLHDKWTRNE